MARRVTVILSIQEYNQFKEAAGLIPLSRWIKDQCINTMAIRLERKLVSDLDKFGEKLRHEKPPVSEPVTAPVSERKESAVVEEPASARTWRQKSCEHGVMKGYRCWQCGGSRNAKAE
jgi:hypothetical protein